MISTYMAKLDLKMKPTKIRSQKINCSIFDVFEIVMASFWVKDKLRKAIFFQKIFLVVNTNIAVILSMFFGFLVI